MQNSNKIYSINGAIIKVKDTKDFFMLEKVFVGQKQLIGEVIAVNENETTIQVYESTAGLKPGEEVLGSGMAMSVTLGPGLVSNIFDGIQRPLKALNSVYGATILPGSKVKVLDEDKLWNVSVKVKVGQTLTPGQIYAVCSETQLIEHRLMVPPNISGIVVSCAASGLHKLLDVIVILEDENGKQHELTLCQQWPIRVPRPTKQRLELNMPLITGQRVIDSLFPIAKGGVAAVPGGFGTGKTMTQHQLAKWAEADLIVYVGCGERGNEMTQVLKEFGSLIDPKSQRPLTERTILIANTSNMPVAAREASIYTGVAIAEYYRDMGYDVAMMADSTSRWAEALREISASLEEMPAEEGFPAYLPSRLSQFYERAGRYKTLGGMEGSISIIGAVSPQGSDFSEPVTQNTKRFVRCFWALSKSLAYGRHYPAIDWNMSYTEYIEDLRLWFESNLGSEFLQFRQEVLNILQDETKWLEIVKLIGSDVLPDEQKLTLEIAKIIRVGFLQQNAYHKIDTYVPLKKQMLMMGIILNLYNKCKNVLKSGALFTDILGTGIFEVVTKLKYDIANDDLKKFEDYNKLIETKLMVLNN
ncbi:MAG: V-type ATP synthase subunit A [Oscillospiraceae bacterium]|nr:V-type ATP synthase subunit A [Oscillospiraceae bacterium]